MRPVAARGLSALPAALALGALPGRALAHHDDPVGHVMEHPAEAASLAALALAAAWMIGRALR